MLKQIPDNMKIVVQMGCYPCFLRQAELALGHTNLDEEHKHIIMRSVMEALKKIDPKDSPAAASTIMHRKIREMVGYDPFSIIKMKYNNYALQMHSDLATIISDSKDRLEAAARLAIAGNVIDFGIYRAVDIGATVRRALDEPLDVDNYAEFKEAVSTHKEILYLLDNAGEIVFDMLLITELQLMGKIVCAVVRGEPVINDCTMSDAKHVALTTMCKVLDNRSDAVGTVIEEMPEPLRKAMLASSTLVISKGQANFETLYDRSGPNTFFLFQSKCEVISLQLGLPKGAMLLAQGVHQSVPRR